MSSSEGLREHYIDVIQRQGFISLHVDIKPTDIEPVFSAFREVTHDIFEKKTEHGQDLLDAFAVQVPGRPLDGKGFIEQRRAGQVSMYEIGRAPGTDNKDTLHFLPITKSIVKEYMRTRGGVPTSVSSLLDQCEQLQVATQKSVKEGFEALGLHNTLLAPRGMEHGNVHLLRVIRYLGSSASSPFIANDPLAELHFDRSKATVAIWESAPGLVGAPGNNNIGNPELQIEELDAMAETALSAPIAHRSQEVKLFMGAGYNHLPDEQRIKSGNLPLLMHGVTDVNPGQERDAVVMFINQHTGLDYGTPGKHETGYGDVRKYMAEEIERHGGMVA